MVEYKIIECVIDLVNNNNSNDVRRQYSDKERRMVKAFTSEIRWAEVLRNSIFEKLAKRMHLVICCVQ